MGQIRLNTDYGSSMLPFTEGESVFDVLKKHEINIGAFCGGNGRCGKCGACISPAGEPQELEKSFFSAEQLKSGVRLTCLVKALDGMTVRPLGTGEDGFEALGAAAADIKNFDGTLHIAIDIGTTTCALCLVNGSGDILASETGVNPQRIYGADVISRISASNSGKGAELKRLITSFLLNKIKLLTKDADRSRIRSVVISGNTTMGHLLMGLDCSTLGVFPFTPVDISLKRFGFRDFFGDECLDCEVIMLPGISAYVGADIVSGMLYCRINSSDKLSLFVDLGTNGEMAIGKRGRILVTSAAAGPAFEGGNLSCGTGSIPGAICSVDIDEEKNISFSTIGGKTPSGLCGTGAVETLAALVKGGLIDETGMMDEEIFDEGLMLSDGIRFTQKDVREMQLAKSAVCAGIKTLMLRYGANASDIDRLFIAGGFGHRLSTEKAAIIGLIPEELAGISSAVGNSSLMGAIQFAITDDKTATDDLVSSSREIRLSEDKDFNKLYIDNMYFNI